MDNEEFNSNSIEKLDENSRCDISWVQNWDPETIPEHAFILIASKRRSGKTHLVRHIIKPIHKRFEKVYLFSETSYLQDNPYDFIPKGNQYNSFQPSVIQTLITSQQEIIERNKKLDKKSRVKNHILIICDDVINDPNIRKNPVLKTLATQGRHSMITVILLAQTISARSGFPAVIRTNVDVFICFILHDQFNRETSAEQYASVVNKKEGMKLINSITCSEPYMAAVFDLSKTHIKSYKDYVYKIKAPDTKPKFKIGNEDLGVQSKKTEKDNQFHFDGYSGINKMFKTFSGTPTLGFRI